MVTLEEFLENTMNCERAINGDGSLSYEAEESIRDVTEMLGELASCGIIPPDTVSYAVRQFDEITSQKVQSVKEVMITELYQFIKDGDKYYILDNPVECKTENGYDILAKYFSRDIDYKDIFCMDFEPKGDEDYEGTIYDMHDLTDESVKKIYEAIKSQEIDNGWDWKEHAFEVLKKKHPEIDNLECIFDFIGEYWMNLNTDAGNVEEFENWIAER